MIKLKHQRATAIITAILIVSVVSIAAITMQGYLYGEMNRTQMVIDGDRMLNGLYGVESWGLSRVQQINSKNNVKDINLQDLNKDLNQITLRENNLVLNGQLVNVNGIFNINYLYSESKCKSGTINSKEQLIQQVFKNIIRNRMGNDLSLSEQELDEVITNIQLFMCANKDNKYEGEKDIQNNIEKTNKDWGYQNIGQLYTDSSELRLVPSFTNDIYKQIAPAITVFPVEMKNEKIQVAINTSDITADLLAAVAGTTILDAENFISSNIRELKSKKTDASEDINKLIKNYINEKKSYSDAERDIIYDFLTSSNKNNFYRITGKASLEGYLMQLHTLANYDKKINVVWRKRSVISG